MSLTESQERKESRQPHIEKDDRWLRINTFDFFGQFSSSPDGSYTIGWADRDPSGHRGGFRESGHGTYVLVCNDELILTRKMERPNDGRVANNGSFVLNDWLFGEDRKAIFYAMDNGGTVLVNHRFEANLLNNAISADGRFAVSQTCNSETPDGNMLCLFDLGSGGLLWQRRPETGWTWDYSFDSEQEVMSVQHKELGEFRYRLRSGEFLDRDRWIEQTTKRGNGFELLGIAQERIQQLADATSEVQIREVIELLSTALSRGLSDYPHQQAIVFRNLGELWERLGDKSAAVENYEEAMRCNPKVGVKRRLNQLRQSLEV